MPSQPWPLYQGKWGKRRRKKKKKKKMLFFPITTVFNAQWTMTIISRQMGEKEEEEEEVDVFKHYCPVNHDHYIKANGEKGGGRRRRRSWRIKLCVSQKPEVLQSRNPTLGLWWTAFWLPHDVLPVCNRLLSPPPPPPPQQHMYGLIGYVSILAVFALKDVTDKSVPWWKILISACHSDWKKEEDKM